MGTPEENLSPVQEGQGADSVKPPIDTGVYGPEISEQAPLAGDTVVEAEPQDTENEHVSDEAPRALSESDEFIDPWERWAEESIGLTPHNANKTQDNAGEEEGAESTSSPTSEDMPEDTDSSTNHEEITSDLAAQAHAQQEQIQDPLIQNQQLPEQPPGPNPEPQLSDGEAPAENISKKNKKKLLGYGGIAAAVAGVTAAAAIALGGSSSEPSDAEATPPPEETIDQYLGDRGQEMDEHANQPPLGHEETPHTEGHSAENDSSEQAAVDIEQLNSNTPVQIEYFYDLGMILKNVTYANGETEELFASVPVENPDAEIWTPEVPVPEPKSDDIVDVLDNIYFLRDMAACIADVSETDSHSRLFLSYVYSRTGVQGLERDIEILEGLEPNDRCGRTSVSNIELVSEAENMATEPEVSAHGDQQHRAEEDMEFGETDTQANEAEAKLVEYDYSFEDKLISRLQARLRLEEDGRWKLASVTTLEHYDS